MTPSRRQFVASMAAVPFLPSVALAGQRSSSAAGDPVLEEVMASLRQLSAEFETQPRTRKSTMRAMEATLDIGAAHLAVYYDGSVRAGLRRRQARLGRAALTEDVVKHARQSRQSNITHEAIEAGITRLEQRGLSGCVRDVGETIKKLRLQAPDQMQAAGFVAIQYDYCGDLNWMIGMMEAVVQIVCALSILEPSPGGEIACGALGLMLGLLYLERQIFC